MAGHRFSSFCFFFSGNPVVPITVTEGGSLRSSVFHFTDFSNIWQIKFEFY